MEVEVIIMMRNTYGRAFFCVAIFCTVFFSAIGQLTAAETPPAAAEAERGSAEAGPAAFCGSTFPMFPMERKASPS
jgi:hypothetical protein